MNLSDNQQIVNALKQILKYYDYLEYDGSCSESIDQLCIKVSDPNANCSLGVIETICAQLGLGYTCEPEEPTRFYIRMMNHNDYPPNFSIEYETENLRPELNSASAYYERASKMYNRGRYELAIEDYNKGLSLETNNTTSTLISLNLKTAKEAKKRSDRERFYWEYHNKFLEREAKRAEVSKRHGTPEWQAKQAEVLKRDGMLCVCGDTATEVHHKIYENLDHEPLSDLVALCRYCYRGIQSGEKIKLWKGSNPMSNKEYEKYLESPNWKEKRKRVLERDSYLCICGERATYVHHKTYDNLGQEPLSDLVALCKNCHDGYHGHLFAKSESFWHMRG